MPSVLVTVLASRRVSQDARVRIAAMLIGMLGTLIAFALLVYADRQDWWKLSLWGTGASLMVATGATITTFPVLRKRFATRL